MAMEQFEKWAGPDKCPVEVDCRAPLNDEFECKDCLYLSKVGWKAALKWALSLEWETDDGAKAISSACIRRELGAD